MECALAEDDKVKIYTVKSGGVTVVSSTSALVAEGALVSDFNYVSPPSDHAIYNLIGRVAAGWPNLEHELDRIIWLLLPAVSPEAGCVTSQLMGATPRYRTIIAQLTLKHRQTSDPRFEKFISRTNSLMQETYEPQEQRNRIIHDASYFDTSRDRAAQFRSWPAKDLRFGINPVDLTDIETTLTKIDALHNKAEKLYIDIAVIPASPERRL
jgi:hypothetical protein